MSNMASSLLPTVFPPTRRRCFSPRMSFPAADDATRPQASRSYNSVTSGLYGKRGIVSSAALLTVLQNFNILPGIALDEMSVIQAGVQKVLSKSKAAGFLRLVFHDGGTFDIRDSSGGMNGSIIYELERPENSGLAKSVKILERAKREIDSILEVSWADLIAVAGAESVSLTGGPVIPVRLGRLDSSVPDPEGKLPEESLDATGLKTCFQNKGFSTQEMVVLSGAHTLGSKGFGSPIVFDNAYFNVLLDKPWKSSGMSSMIGLQSDRVLPEDDECLRWIKIYAEDQKRFFNDFTAAYTKLVNNGALWRTA